MWFQKLTKIVQKQFADPPSAPSPYGRDLFPTKVGAKCLAAVALDNQDRALRPRWSYFFGSRIFKSSKNYIRKAVCTTFLKSSKIAVFHNDRNWILVFSQTTMWNSRKPSWNSLSPTLCDWKQLRTNRCNSWENSQSNQGLFPVSSVEARSFSWRSHVKRSFYNVARLNSTAKVNGRSLEQWQST